MTAYVLSFQEIDQSNLQEVGGKGLNLGKLSQIEEVHVPDGCCVTTEAYERTVMNRPAFRSYLDQLSQLDIEDHETIKELTEKIRNFIENIEIPADIEKELMDVICNLGIEQYYAVRSSATAEDLPHASFAGQQDSFLNITGNENILCHVSKCWASLFTERAVMYRIKHGFDHRKVELSVIVQRMVFPQVSGIMFTADPVSSNRKVVSIDASFGLGEALVSGLVSADNYKVREGRITEKKIASKEWSVDPLHTGGTAKRAIASHLQQKQTLTDRQILQLASLGRKIEASFGSPQDIEWCLVDDTFFMVQSRPITTLYPIPDAKDDENRVYFSFGHQQMMTDVIRPLGMSLLRMI
ncbi:pyruvate, water dikinase [Alteribacillus iranensis]|uniref:Pyruvate, water dikinase n=1 Tax=Alteribacillus iranensis TaxID=930128 RepID=A0A1I2F3M9_9BACI|nr:pyruvate, water dikinase [Alteribacillus iranensis]